MVFKNQHYLFFYILCSFLKLNKAIPSFFVAQISPSSNVSGGHWQLLQSSVGVSAMHMQLLPNNKVLIFDRMDAGPSNISLPAGSFCPKNDCSAHSVLYDVVSNNFRPLRVLTDTWCSSGSLDRNGTLIQTGGFNDGEKVIRLYKPCDVDSTACDWNELNDTRLIDRRWYATNQVLPDGRVIIVGGRRAFTYEFYPKHDFLNNNKSFYFRFLVETRDPEENNLYPFLHLLPDGNLFIFANKKSILFDYREGIVLKQFPLIPGDDKRNYPSSGSSVLLPLRLSSAGHPVVEVLVCGGAPAGAFLKSDKRKVFVEASRTCGRLRVNDPNPQWLIESMPMPRVMSDMVMLPTGDVIIINGASNGTAGWEDAVNPVLNPILYSVNGEPSRRFTVFLPSTIPRMYHSSAILLPDGRILVGGSNPHITYVFTGPYPTELSLEAYNPYYMDTKFNSLKPSIVSVESGNTVSYGRRLGVSFSVSLYKRGSAFVALVSPSFTTHSLGMNQRMVVLNTASEDRLAIGNYKLVLDGPTNANVAPPGYYMLFVVHSGIPSHAVWVKVM
ncbi:nitrate transporter 1.2-like [Hibiscus syriacus]|uniref:Nitrate transporter 1.2-like n=1 Tax=Hibiscus syriacus TaxID=106335 RepID=A0A6A2WML2_HIBSY|nr:aldehyde oxidase GLOX-like [Hibiscus syriacus]KAE8661413.1 nitrate transporter 1.2-like [Hibiscus syriacus]